jgi:hypothetical protein
MKVSPVTVRYRDSESKQNVLLAIIDVEIPETVDEAIQLLGEGKVIDLALEHHIAEKRRQFRRENRPKKPRSPRSAIGKFRTLSPEQQEELLKRAGVL